MPAAPRPAHAVPPEVELRPARTADGAEIFWGAVGDGPPLLLISGQGSTHRGWLHVVPELAAAHRVVLYEHRGIARSTLGAAGSRAAADEYFTTRAFARDAIAVLDAAGVDRAAVYGHSLGGRVAQWLGIDHPERVGRLVLASTTGGDRLGRPRTPEADAILASGDGSRMAPLFFSAEFAAAHPGVVADFFARKSSIPTRRGHYRASRGHDAWDELHRIAAPTLVLHGGADPVTDASAARLLAERIPGAELLVVDGEQHCPHLESRAARDRARAFLAAPL